MTKRQLIKSLLSQLLEEHTVRFKQMYAKGDLSKDIDDVIRDIPASKLNVAINQCENTLKDRNKWLGKYRDKQINDILDEDS